ncbi:hypothetical protein [Metabacillus idriensis]|uniref:hypothetical protein n=1 Tax=Metabacillus idriensis TaxID=324768 RepID=UPI00174C2C59|nr:hypothetical protein [Metabacillus idriensis]
MKKYIFFVLLVLVLELGILVGVSMYFNTNLVNTMFFGSCLFVFFAFLISSTGDSLSKNSQAAVFDSLLGSYKPQHEKTTLTISPFLVGSILCFVAYFPFYYLGIIGK